MSRFFPAWTKTDCDLCGSEFMVTRVSPKTFSDIGDSVVCGECEEFKRGEASGDKRIAKLEAELARKDALIALLRRILKPHYSDWRIDEVLAEELGK